MASPRSRRSAGSDGSHPSSRGTPRRRTRRSRRRTRPSSSRHPTASVPCRRSAAPGSSASRGTRRSRRRTRHRSKRRSSSPTSAVPTRPSAKRSPGAAARRDASTRGGPRSHRRGSMRPSGAARGESDHEGNHQHQRPARVQHRVVFRLGDRLARSRDAWRPGQNDPGDDDRAPPFVTTMSPRRDDSLRSTCAAPSQAADPQ